MSEGAALMTEQATSTSREEAPTGDDSARPGDATPETPFTDLDDYLALRRLGGLALSPDGIRLVTTVAARTPDGKRFSTSLWEVDPGGQRLPRRLTRSAAGESHPAFLPDGRLLFSSAARSGGEDGRTPRTAVRCGRCPRPVEARLLARRGGGSATSPWPATPARRARGVELPGPDLVADAERRRPARTPESPRSCTRAPGPILGPRPRTGRRSDPVSFNPPVGHGG